MAYGRGGAGNIQAAEQDTTRASADLEANLEATVAELQNAIAGDATEKNERQYAHTGRGGAGNYYSPRELSERGHFSDAHRSHILGDGTLPPTDTAAQDGAPPSYNTAPTTAQPPKKVGRGGAGNMAFGVTEDEARAARKRIAEREAQEKLTADVEKGVEESLAMPPKAKLSGAEPYRATSA